MEPVSRRRFLGLGAAAFLSSALASLLPVKALAEEPRVCGPEYLNCHKLKRNDFTVMTQKKGEPNPEWFTPVTEEPQHYMIRFLHARMKKTKALERMEKGHRIKEYEFPLKEKNYFIRVWAKNHFGKGLEHTVRIETVSPKGKLLVAHACGKKDVPGGWSIELHADQEIFPRKRAPELLELLDFVKNIMEGKYSRSSAPASQLFRK